VQLLLALFLMHGGNEHAAGGDTHHLPGGEIQNGHGGLAHQVLRLIIMVDAGDDGAVGAGAVVQGEFQELIALFHRFTGLDLHGPEVGAAEGVEVYLLLLEGLHLQGGQVSLFLGLLHGVQLRQSLGGVDAGEEGLALGNRGGRIQMAPGFGALPGAAALAGTDLVKDLAAAVGHEGGQQDGADAHGLQQVIEDGGKAGLLALLLGQLPGGVLVDILIGPVNDLEDLLQAVLQLELVHLGLVAIPQAAGQLFQLTVGRVILAIFRQGAAKILLHHGAGTADQIAQVVGQVYIDGVNQQLVGEVAVGAEGEGTQQEEAQSVHTEHLRQDIGIHHIALGL